MAERDRSKIQKSLRSKGFIETAGGNHQKYIFYHNGLKTQIFTIISRGASYKTYSQNLLSKISKQLKITNSQLLQLIDCPLDQDGYITELMNQDLL